MNSEHVPAWVAAHPLQPAEIDCATAVMLKILDGKCKMSPLEKEVMAALYDALAPCRAGQAGLRLGAPIHALIAGARAMAAAERDETLRNTLYEHRVLAESAISRPVMKAFKAMIRAEGLFAGLDPYPAPEED